MYHVERDRGVFRYPLTEERDAAFVAGLELSLHILLFCILAIPSPEFPAMKNSRIFWTAFSPPLQPSLNRFIIQEIPGTKSYEHRWNLHIYNSFTLLCPPALSRREMLFPFN